MTAFIGTVIAIVGIAIAYFQWRTAHQKVALEILEKRFSIYEELRRVVSTFLQNLEFSLESHRSYIDAQNRARFHFGAEVDTYLEKLRKDMLRGHYFDRYQAAQAANVAVDEQIARLDRVMAFHAEIDRMFIPYMRIDQRMPLWWWGDFGARFLGWLQQMKR